MAQINPDQLAALIALAKAGTPLERADAISELKRKLKLNVKVAELIGRTSQHVEQMLLLSSAPSEVRDEVASGKLSPTLAVRLIRSSRRAGIPVVEALQAAREAAEAKGVEKITPTIAMGSVSIKSRHSLQHVYRKLRSHLQTQRAAMRLELSRVEVEELYRVLEAKRFR